MLLPDCIAEGQEEATINCTGAADAGSVGDVGNAASVAVRPTCAVKSGIWRDYSFRTPIDRRIFAKRCMSAV
jgi:hypothetical protein